MSCKFFPPRCLWKWGPCRFWFTKPRPEWFFQPTWRSTHDSTKSSRPVEPPSFGYFARHGHRHGHEVVILVNGANTHNFVQDQMVCFMNLAAQPTPRLTVMVGNGSEIGCDQVCKHVLVLIQGLQFSFGPVCHGSRGCQHGVWGSMA